MSEQTGPVVSFDLNDPRLGAEEDFESYDVNPDGDAFAAPAPVPDGSYDVLVAVQHSKFTRRHIKTGQNKGKPFLTATLELTVVDPEGEFDGRKIFADINTLIQQSSGSSTIAGVLKALGVEVDTRTNDGALCQLLGQAVAAEPTCRVKTRWRAAAKDAEGKYQTLRSGMRSFPALNDEGTKFNHLIEDPQTGENVSARADVVRFDLAE